ncbi:MAG: DUF2911 domain-containing protein [Acidobacteria bacterium]|nr:DUF2911 domain-containing protein [Acidobacteriota bacterium]
MKRGSFLVLSVFVLALGLFSLGQAPSGNRAKASATLNGKKLVIEYGQPELRGRDVMSMATPGTVWRMGMNEVTELNTEAALKFTGLTLQRGKYSLWTKKVSEQEWLLIVNRKTGQWGTEYDGQQDLGSTPWTLSELKTPVEQMTITLSGEGKQGKLELAWGTRKLSTTFTAD